jgi:hypothetical protein
MKNLLLLVLIVSCSRSPVNQPPQDGPVLTEDGTSVILPDDFKVVFTTNSNLSWMHDLVKVANCITNNQDFLAEVLAVKSYTYTNATSRQVYESILNPKPVFLSTYSTRNPFSRVIATTYSSEPNAVYFNLRKNPREMSDMANTAIHEGLGHIQGWSHGDNSPIGKSESIPWKLGEIAEKYTEVCSK